MGGSIYDVLQVATQVWEELKTTVLDLQQEQKTPTHPFYQSPNQPYSLEELTFFLRVFKI